MITPPSPDFSYSNSKTPSPKPRRTSSAPPHSTQTNISNLSISEDSQSETLTVSSWIRQLDLPVQVQEKYIHLFEQEEVYSIEQVKKLNDKYLHWMGVKVGSILVMMAAIQKLRERVTLTTTKKKENKNASKKTKGNYSKECEDEEIVADVPVNRRSNRRIQNPNDMKREDSTQDINTSNISSSDNWVDDEKFFPQAGGHGGVIARVKPGLIRKVTDGAECAFYLQIKDTKKIPESFKPFFPRLEQVLETSPGILGLKKQVAVIMEDLTFGYSKPCVLDMKMGTKTYAEDSFFVKKKLRQIKDDGTTSSRYGLRITGYRTYNVKSGQFIECTKEAAERITTLDLLESNMNAFFYNGNEVRADVIKYFLEKLTSLLGWMEIQMAYRFFSSSLLFVYDGTMDVFKADVRMIDFAHVAEIRDNGVDEGYIKGLKKLIDCLRRLTEK